MTAILYAYYIVAAVLVFYLIFPFLTTLFGQILRGAKYQILNSKFQIPNLEFDFANIITAYRNVEIAKPLVLSLLNQPHRKQHIYLVADNADISNWDIQHEQLTVLKPESALNLKVKSIIYATERYVRLHKYAVIWDADNLAHPDFMAEMNRYANAGHKAIQGQRTAKNLDATMAAADSLGEYYKNYIERYLPPRLGSSTVISGSGMAVEQTLYNTYLYGKEIQEGQHLWKKMMQEDKILQNHILRANERIMYAKDAICYDEKVVNAEQVETQRSRWLFSYFQNLPNSTGFILRGLFSANWNKLLFGLITAAPPLFILVGLSGVVFLLGLLIDIRVSAAIGVGGIIFVGTIFWTLYLSDAPRAVYDSVLVLPNFIFRQIRGLLKMGNPNKNFKHSEHTRQVSIEDVLKR